MREMKVDFIPNADKSLLNLLELPAFPFCSKSLLKALPPCEFTLDT